MAGSVNKVILVGNLGKDPEVRRLNSGDQVVNFSVATSETWRDKNSGERKEHTEWHNVVIFNENLGKVAEQYCKKGTKVYIEGQLQTRKWQDQSGADRYTTEVVLQRFRGELQLLDSRGGGADRDSFPEEGGARSSGFNRAAASERRPALSERRAAGRRGRDRRRHPVLRGLSDAGWQSFSLGEKVAALKARPDEGSGRAVRRRKGPWLCPCSSSSCARSMSGEPASCR